MACNRNRVKKSGYVQGQDSNSKKYIGRCPLKAYPLSCSEYGSPCLDYQYRDKNNNCRRTGKVVHAVVCCPPNSKPISGKSSSKLKCCCEDCNRDWSSRRKPKQRATCCDSCCSNCKCDEGATGTKQPCCGLYCGGGPCKCKDNRKSKKEYSYYSSSKKDESQQRTKAPCCDSCCANCTCQDNKTMRRANKTPCCDSCCENCNCQGTGVKGCPCEDGKSKMANRRAKFRAIGVMPFRQGGVIPNYMGYIPGLHTTFGAPYGVTANQLLERHFSKQQNYY